MEIIIHGTGAMGNVVKELANEDKDIKITGFADELTTEEGEVIIDFSHFSRLDTLLDYANEKKIPLVIATTGYTDEIYNKMVEVSKNIPILLSSNMSLGINLMQDILEKIVPILYGSYDIELIEKHHNKKVDSPSGTAKTILDVIEKGCSEKMERVYGREGIKKREKNEIGVSVVRGGTIAGEHSVLFCGNDEIIEIKHTALSKKIFGIGAIKAAKFLVNKEPGFYNMKDLFNNL